MEVASTSSCLCCGVASSDYLEHLLEMHKFSLAKAREIIRASNKENAEPSGTHALKAMFSSDTMVNNKSVFTVGGVPITLPENGEGRSIHLHFNVNGSDVSTEDMEAVTKVLKGEEANDAAISSSPDLFHNKGFVATSTPKFPRNTASKTSSNSHTLSKPLLQPTLSATAPSKANAVARSRIDIIPLESKSYDDDIEILEEVVDKHKLFLPPIPPKIKKADTIPSPSSKVKSGNKGGNDEKLLVVANTPKVHMFSKPTTPLSETSNSFPQPPTQHVKKSTIRVFPLPESNDDEIMVLDGAGTNGDQVMTPTLPTVKMEVTDTLISSSSSATLKSKSKMNREREIKEKEPKRNKVDHGQVQHGQGGRSKNKWKIRLALKQKISSSASAPHCQNKEMFKYNKVAQLVKGGNVHRCSICSDEFPNIIQDIHSHVVEKHDINFVQYHALYYKKVGWGNVSIQ